MTLTISIAELLAEMKQMFDLRPGKLSLRKEFEARKWILNESFADYFNEKLILVNRIPVAEEELEDYIIDSITDEQLQGHARLINFKSK